MEYKIICLKNFDFRKQNFGLYGYHQVKYAKLDMGIYILSIQSSLLYVIPMEKGKINIKIIFCNANEKLSKHLIDTIQPPLTVSANSLY